MDDDEQQQQQQQQQETAMEPSAAAVEAGAAYLRSTHWDGNGCGTEGTGGCSRCYGPSPDDSYEVAKDVLAAALPVELRELRAEIDRLTGEVEARRRDWDAGFLAVREQRDQARTEIESSHAEWLRMAEAHDALVGERDAAVAESSRLRAAIQFLHSEDTLYDPPLCLECGVAYPCATAAALAAAPPGETDEGKQP